MQERSTRTALTVVAVAAVVIAAAQIWNSFGATYALYWYMNPSLGETRHEVTSEVKELWTVNGAAGEEVVIELEAGLWIFEVIRPTPDEEGRVSVNLDHPRGGGSWSGGAYRIVHVGPGYQDSDYFGIPAGQVGLSVDPHTDWTILIKPVACP